MTDALDHSRKFWDAHAERDPLWAVLSDAGKEERKWDVRRFFQTGVNEIALVFYQLESHGIEVARGSALDFGCGVGRLTQALAQRFENVVGVDVSPRMVETAASLNRFPDRASYVWNDAPHLKAFSDRSFDFIYTNIVLQHIMPDVTVGYLREFLRILKPAGVLVFQLPSHTRGPDDPLLESSASPMPDEAYQAALSVAGIPNGSVGPHAEITLDVDVRNISEMVWSHETFGVGVGVISAGNHWLDQTGARMLQCDDGRTPLPEAVPPGGACRVALTITTPAAPGDYQCEIDLAHEGVRWFRDRDSAVVRFPVHVHAEGASDVGAAAEASSDTAVRVGPAPDGDWPAAAPGDPRVADPGDFPMHGVHTDVVSQLIAAGGGELLERTADRSCGQDWISYRYFVRKRTT
jgi:SAM-dependent methyltransferase